MVERYEKNGIFLNILKYAFKKTLLWKHMISIWFNAPTYNIKIQENKCRMNNLLKTCKPSTFLRLRLLTIREICLKDNGKEDVNKNIVCI